MPATVPADVDKALLAGDPPPAGLSAEERRAYEQLVRTFKQVDYARLMGSRPQTLYGIADSPVGLAAWLLDHNDADGQPAAAVAAALDRTASATGELTRDEILDNITLYWLTNTGVSASRLYWEYKGGFFNAKGVSIPVAVSVFPGEQYQAPRSWTEQAYPNLIYFNERRPRRPLRRLGAAAAVRRGASRCIPVAAVVQSHVTRQGARLMTIFQRESRMPSLAGATEWLNSEPLTSASSRAAPCWSTSVRTPASTGSARSRTSAAGRRSTEITGSSSIGIQTPEFAFEHDLETCAAR